MSRTVVAIEHNAVFILTLNDLKGCVVMLAREKAAADRDIEP